jgi:hypothetical protein
MRDCAGVQVKVNILSGPGGPSPPTLRVPPHKALLNTCERGGEVG